MKTILGLFLLFIWLHSNLGAILPRFELKVLLLICYFKISSKTGFRSTLSVMCHVAPAALQSEINSDVEHCYVSTESNPLILSFVFTQGVEHKVPDCAN